MVIKKILVISLCLFAAQMALCQEWAFTHVEKLSSSINSDAEESMPLLSPDGKTLYFARFMHSENAGGKYSGQDIWLSKFEGTAWRKAEKIHALNNRNNNAVIGVGADGKTLYLLDASSSKQLKTISFSRLVNGNWAKPELIPIDGMDHEGFVGFYVSPDFQVILLSMKGIDSKGEEDIYVCLKDKSGQWMHPKNLGTAINTTGFEISPFLSADKKRLYFSSNGHRGLGDADIFFSDRLYDSWEAWSVPQNLGEVINSKSFDAFFSIYGDSLCYFTSNRDNKMANIYKARVSYLETNMIQHKLSRDEMNTLFGVDISTKLAFNNDKSIALTAIHKELLWYLGSKLIGKNEIKIVLEAASNANDEITEKRIAAILGYLALSGVEGSRVIKQDYFEIGNGFGVNDINLVFVK
jgi:hypothetical protein